MPPPLAERMRPQSLQELVGQDHLSPLLTQLISAKKPISILLWGPPGCGKTTLAKLYAQSFEAQFFSLSAVYSGLADLKKVVQEAKDQKLWAKTSIVFIDEIHRFNKAQQDALLPYVERGDFVLVGATTENPSYNLNAALLSRLQVLPLKSLGASSLNHILERCEAKNKTLAFEEDARAELLSLAQGDGRYLLNCVESLQTLEKKVSLQDIEQLLQKRAALYDRHDEQHFRLISALHKSIRGSDPDASLYWLERMLVAGEDPRYLARRLIRVASEDVGLADSNALTLTLNALKTYETLGSPEGELALAQATVYLALAPKSNALYVASKKARSLAQASTQLPPPAHILNACNKWMEKMGYGKGYQYDHDLPEKFSGQNYFPKALEKERPSFYEPEGLGDEQRLKAQKEALDHLRLNKQLG